jgi:hypothetical protein
MRAKTKLSLRCAKGLFNFRKVGTSLAVSLKSEKSGRLSIKVRRFAALWKEQFMDAISYLKDQHREIEALFEKIEKLPERSGREKKAVFLELATKLDHHAKIEEKHFYPEGREVDEDVTLEAYEEHAVLRSLIRKIKGTHPSDETFMAKVTVLKEVVEHHVEEEEDEYFPKCRRKFGSERLEILGEKLEDTYLKLEGKKPARAITKKAA